jgi:hypothetical protein
MEFPSQEIFIGSMSCSCWDGLPCLEFKMMSVDSILQRDRILKISFLETLLIYKISCSVFLLNKLGSDSHKYHRLENPSVIARGNSFNFHETNYLPGT